MRNYNGLFKQTTLTHWLPYYYIKEASRKSPSASFYPLHFKVPSLKKSKSTVMFVHNRKENKDNMYFHVNELTVVLF